MVIVLVLWVTREHRNTDSDLRSTNATEMDDSSSGHPH